MSAEPQVLEAEYGFPLDYAVPAAGQATNVAEKTKASFFKLTTMLECFWSFYEAMRLGKPMPDADEKLATLGKALRTNTPHT